jgi:hypothetical protein
MLKRSAQMALAIFVTGMLAAGSAHAQTEKCQGSKMKAGEDFVPPRPAREVGGEGRAHRPGEGHEVRDEVLVFVRQGRVEAAVLTTGDAGTIETKIDRFVAQIAANLALTPPSKCQSGKLKAAGKKAKCMLGAEAKALSKSIAPTSRSASRSSTRRSRRPRAAVTAARRSATRRRRGPGRRPRRRRRLRVDAGPACDCGSAEPAFLNFTTSLGSGNCGNVDNSSGTSILTLGCNSLYTGGGAAAVPPATVPDYGTTITKTSCCRNKFFALSAATSGDTGSNLNCSATGCLYGPPLPIVSGASVCVVNNVALDAAGYGYCDAGSMTIDLPLISDVRLSLDSLPKRCDGSSPSPGLRCAVDGDCTGLCVDDSANIQPCPICNPVTLVCNGGTNNGIACTPGSLLVSGPEFPTSHDCPLAQAPIGQLPVPYLLTTGTPSKTSVDQPSQVRVFCGFCGDPDNAVFKNPAVACLSDADCAAFTTGCGLNRAPRAQHTPGAFGSQAARTITENGSPAGPITTGGPAASATLASVFCIRRPSTAPSTASATCRVRAPSRSRARRSSFRSPQAFLTA